MKRAFVESKNFQQFVDSLGDPNLVADIQSLILEDPESGAVVQGTGGIRKMRVADRSRGKGTRGGFRVLFLDLPDKEKSYLLVIYQKGRKEDISNDEKKALKELVQKIKKEAR